MFSPHSHLSVKSKVPTIPGSHSRGLYRFDLASLSCSASRSSDRFSPRRQYQPAGCLRPSTLLPGENESDANILKKIGCPGFQNLSHQKRRHRKNTKIIRHFSNGKAASAVSRSMRQTAESARTESGGHGQRPAPGLSAQIRPVETPVETLMPARVRLQLWQSVRLETVLPLQQSAVLLFVPSRAKHRSGKRSARLLLSALF